MSRSPRYGKFAGMGIERDPAETVSPCFWLAFWRFEFYAWAWNLQFRWAVSSSGE